MIHPATDLNIVKIIPSEVEGPTQSAAVLNPSPLREGLGLEMTKENPALIHLWKPHANSAIIEIDGQEVEFNNLRRFGSDADFILQDSQRISRVFEAARELETVDIGPCQRVLLRNLLGSLVPGR